MRVNANIKSIEEAKERLDAGEVFYTQEGCRIVYSDHHIYDGESPYRLGNTPLWGLWHEFETWE